MNWSAVRDGCVWRQLPKMQCGEGQIVAVTLERCEGDALVLRAGPDHYRHGDPYTTAGTVDVVGDSATVRGYVSTHPLALADYVDMRHALRSHGIRRVRIERRRGGRDTDKEWRL